MSGCCAPSTAKTGSQTMKARPVALAKPPSRGAAPCSWNKIQQRPLPAVSHTQPGILKHLLDFSFLCLLIEAPTGPGPGRGNRQDACRLDYNKMDLLRFSPSKGSERTAPSSSAREGCQPCHDAWNVRTGSPGYRTLRGEATSAFRGASGPQPTYARRQDS